MKVVDPNSDDPEKMIFVNPECTFCDVECETLEHLFLDCHYVRTLWENLEKRIDYHFEREEKMLGLFRNPYSSTLVSPW